MKKFWLLCILLIPLAAFAATDWVQTNQATAAWDAVTTLADGKPVPATDTVKYQVWTKRESDAPVKVGGEITATQLTITFSAEGRYTIGVQAIRTSPNFTEPQASAVSWSDDPLVVATNPFGVVYIVPPAKPKGLRPAG